MHFHTLEEWQHSHDFSGDRQSAEDSTKTVMWLTAATMVAEIVAGIWFGSMALLADGWHMATHVAAFGITIFAYRYARKHAQDPAYTYGTGKVSVLGGFASAIALAVIALVMGIESVVRLFEPQTIKFNEAIAVAALGLAVNLISAWLLQEHHHHSHYGEPHEHNEHHHHDHNLRAAYLHVLTDALTSVLAIIALIAGKFLGWVWLDAVMGLVGMAVIAKWSYGLITDTSSILLDGSPNKQIKLDIIATIEAEGDTRIADLHIWYLGQNSLAASISLVTHYPKSPQYYKEILSYIPSLVHTTVEVNQCHGEPCGN